MAQIQNIAMVRFEKGGPGGPPFFVPARRALPKGDLPMTKPRKNSLTSGRRKPLAWMPDFLAELRASGNIRQAARTAKIAQTTAYDARGRHAHFRRAWDETLAAAQDSGGLVGELYASATAPAADPEP